MTSAKILYLARYRVPHAIMSLQPEFTRHLIGVDRTCIASPVPRDELWTVFEQYGVDTSNFDYAPDSEIYIRIRNKDIKAKVVKMPFYKK